MHQAQTQIITSNFNPRSPHGERRQKTISQAGDSQFQSTLPARGATAGVFALPLCLTDFNPRSPHGERHNLPLKPFARRNFNPRSPHGERHVARIVFGGFFAFQSTLPARGATEYGGNADTAQDISIHAPRTGSDAGFTGGKKERLYFNPRSPHGERPRTARTCFCASNFNPRSPHGERPPRFLLRRTSLWISIHAPRTGSDSGRDGAGSHGKHFNPRSPHGERRPGSCFSDGFLVISIHAPRTGSDADRILSNMRQIISIHAPRTGSDGMRTKQMYKQ